MHLKLVFLNLLKLTNYVLWLSLRILNVYIKRGVVKSVEKNCNPRALELLSGVREVHFCGYHYFARPQELD